MALTMLGDAFVFRPDGRLWAAPLPEGSLRVRFRYASIEPPEVAPGLGLADAPPAPDAEPTDLRDAFGRVPDDELALLVRAREWLQWRLENRHCGRCGTLLQRHRDPDERAMVCPACGAAFNPRLSPAVIVLVTRGPNEVLLERPVRAATPFWRLVSGFVEAGETAEEAVRREIAEETALRVRDVRYVGSQSWPFPGSLMLAFRAEHDGGDPRPDGVEIAECRFFRRDALPALPPGMSIARRLIEAWASAPPDRS